MDGKLPRITGPVLKVFSTFMAQPDVDLAGSEIAASTKLATGTLYPILLRLERGGLLSSHWETDDPHALGRPRRRFYRVTGIGARQMKAALADVKESVFGGDLVWN